MSLFNDISKTVEEMDNPSHEVKLKKAVQEKPSVYPSNVYITPIAKSYNNQYGKPCSRRDWDEQIERGIKGEQIMWDGPPLNRPQPTPGDLMIIWFYNKHVQVYSITEVLKPSQRLPSWSMNIGQRDRRVVYLENPITIDWDTWLSLDGYKRCMGTTNVNSCKNNIIEYWLSHK